MTKLLLALLAATALTACSGDEPSSGTRSQSESGARAQVSATHGDADVAFVQDMTPHHQGALEMAELAEERAEDPQVAALAERIRAAQAPELDLMAAMAEAWDVELDAGGHGGGHGSGHGDGDTAALEPLSGAAFDREFLTRMIAHHESALPMAKQELTNGENPEAKELAQAVLRVQEAEIAEMQRLLAQLQG